MFMVTSGSVGGSGSDRMSISGDVSLMSIVHL